MDVIEAIKTRRSVGKVTEQEPDRTLIEKMLESARWAPNHYHTEPYSFAVLSGKGRDRLGDAYGRINQAGLSTVATEEEKHAVYEKGLKKARRSPYVIVIKVEPSHLEKVIYEEEIAATACAVQNMLLAAHDLGLGAMWRSGAPSYHPIMKKAFGVSEHGLVLGYVYVGHPAAESKKRERRQLNQMVTWIKE